MCNSVCTYLISFENFIGLYSHKDKLTCIISSKEYFCSVIHVEIRCFRFCSWDIVVPNKMSTYLPHWPGINCSARCKDRYELICTYHIHKKTILAGGRSSLSHWWQPVMWLRKKQMSENKLQSNIWSDLLVHYYNLPPSDTREPAKIQ